MSWAIGEKKKKKKKIASVGTARYGWAYGAVLSQVRCLRHWRLLSGPAGGFSQLFLTAIASVLVTGGLSVYAHQRQVYGNLNPLCSVT